MQSGGQSAGIQLQVGLDLAFFRKQLPKLGAAAANYSLPINIRFDRRSVQNELNALGRNISQRKYRLEVATNLAAEIKNAGTLAKALSGLDNAIQKNKGMANRAVAGVTGGTVDASKIQALVNKATKPALQALYSEMSKASIPMAAVGTETVKNLRNAILSGVPRLTTDLARGISSGLNPKMKENGTSSAKLFVDAFKSATGIASPSKVFKALGEFSADGLEIGFLNGLKDFKTKVIGEIKQIVALMKLELASVGDVRIGLGTGAARAGARGGRQYMNPIGPLPEGSREPWAFSQYRYQPFMAQPGQVRGAGVPPMRTRQPFLPAPPVMGTTSSPGMLGQARLALPAAGETSARAMREAALALREFTARQRSDARSASVMGESRMYATVAGQVPLGGTAPRLPAGNRGGALALRDAGAQTPLSLDYYKNAFKYSEALKVAQTNAGKLTAANLPLIGGLRNIAGEFGQAAKQVLLYGTTYKGLAFITSLPGQVLNAAKSQQQYNNALQTATQDTGTYGKELLYVDGVQRAFGLDLETTRTGFVRLYASMAPTGFDSGSIEKLFTGISAATAALQLTPDKAERVIYAFGQMASKGQIMSEELKGQLGDVLPGALAIFSKAAGMSVKEFSKAMEDGVFTGNRFREVFAKVSDELMNRFGTGAQAAGKSMQGLINVVSGDFKRTLESFAPLANSAAQAILGPLGGSLKQLSMSAQIATGEIERSFMQLQQAQKDLKELKAAPGIDAKEIKAAETNVAALTVRYEALNKAAQDPAINKQAQDIQKFTEELTRAGTFVLNLASGIGSVLSPILNFFGSNLTTTISLVTSLYLGFQAMRLATLAVMGALLLLKTVSAALGLGQAAMSANALSGAFGVLGIQVSGASIKVIGLTTALRVLAGATVIGLVVTGISLIAGAFATMRDRAKEASDASRDAAKSAIEAASTGSVAQASMAVQNILAEGRADAAALKTLQGIRARSTKEQRSGVAPLGLTIEEAVALQGSKLTAGIVTGGVTRGGRREVRVPSGQEMKGLEGQFGSVAGVRKVSLEEAKAAEVQAAKTAKTIGINIPTPGKPGAEETGTGATKGAAKTKQERESQLPMLQLELDKTKELFAIDQQLIGARLADNASLVSSLELQKQLTELKYQGKQIALEQIPIDEKQAKMAALAVEYEKAIMQSQLSLQLDMQKAREDLQKSVGETVKGYELENEYQQRYYELVQQGISPVLAKVRVEVEKTFRKEKERIDTLTEQYELQKASLEVQMAALVAQGGLSDVDSKRLTDIKERIRLLDVELEKMGLLKGSMPGAQAGAITAAEGATQLAPARVRLEELAEASKLALEKLQDPVEQIKSISAAVSESIGSAFKGLITGATTAQEALANVFQGIADSFADMVAQMITEWLKAQLIKGFMSLFPGGGALADLNPTAAGGDWMGAVDRMNPTAAYANGGIAPGGFQAFANGGIVTGPTLGLVGEGRYNEAVIPLPDGKSVPVDLGGAMGNQITSNIVVNVSSDGKTSSSGAGSDSAGLGRKLEGAVKQVIVDELRPGGLLSGRR